QDQKRNRPGSAKIAGRIQPAGTSDAGRIRQACTPAGRGGEVGRWKGRRSTIKCVRASCPVAGASRVVTEAHARNRCAKNRSGVSGVLYWTVCSDRGLTSRSNFGGGLQECHHVSVVPNVQGRERQILSKSHR